MLDVSLRYVYKSNALVPRILIYAVLSTLDALIDNSKHLSAPADKIPLFPYYKYTKGKT